MNDTASVISDTETLVEAPPDFSLDVASWEITHPSGKGQTGHPGFAKYVYDEIVSSQDVVYGMAYDMENPKWAVNVSTKSKSACREDGSAEFENWKREGKGFFESFFGACPETRLWGTRKCEWTLRD